MNVKNVWPGTSTFRQVKALYHSAFPEQEQLPFSRMVLLHMTKPSVALLAYYEGGAFVGVTFTVKTRNILYINYIAVAPTVRNHGYGASILDTLHRRWPMPQICDVKVPEPGDWDYPQDVGRIDFWKRNGFNFYQNRHIITNPHGIRYYICGKGTDYQKQTYFGVFDHLSFGPGAIFRSLRNM